MDLTIGILIFITLIFISLLGIIYATAKSVQPFPKIKNEYDRGIILSVFSSIMATSILNVVLIALLDDTITDKKSSSNVKL